MTRTEELLEKIGPLIDTINTLIANACHENYDLKVEFNVERTWPVGHPNEIPHLELEIYERKLIKRQR